MFAELNDEQLESVAGGHGHVAIGSFNGNYSNNGNNNGSYNYNTTTTAWADASSHVKNSVVAYSNVGNANSVTQNSLIVL